MKIKTLLSLVLIMAILGLFAACGRTKPRLVTVPGATLAEKLDWLDLNAAGNTGYLLKITAADEELAAHNLFYFGSDITIQLKGIGKERAVSFSDNGSLFAVGSGVTLVLENIAMAGASGNNHALIRVNSGGSLQINQGVTISGNSGSGVYNNGGTVTMNGGEISGNNGGGVRNDIYYTSIDGEYVTIIGTFTMAGGKISGNTAPSSGGGVYNNGIFTVNGGEISGNTGGGVFNRGTFAINGGKISGNTSASFDGGGVHNGVIYTMVDGVYVAVNGTFTMSGGEISENTSSPFDGGGVSNYGTFLMEDGKISGNTASIGGGVDNHGTFTMKGGKVSGNTAVLYGGGVSNSVNYTYSYDGYVSHVIFSMSGGEISDNTASSYGDGLFVGNGAVLDKTGGTIAGDIEMDN